MLKSNTLFVVIFAIAFVGLCWVPYDPMEQSFREERFAGPSLEHWLGIDGLGRDVLSRLWRGLANTTYMGLGATLLNALFASLLLVVERKGGWVAQRGLPILLSVWLGIPVLFISLILITFLKPSAPTLIFAVSLGSVPLAYRQLRVIWFEQVGALYVQASETLGARGWHLFRRTLWPNLWPDMVALLKLVFAMSVLEISGLAFLGLVGDPDFPELGSMLRQNQSYLLQDAWLLIGPGIVLCGLLAVVHWSRE